ncbi:MAG: mucoidy inhibitor MuiA family protein [Deltaproteobacteria bacterium]|nr:mucoidy inhibitor MuiA family protein [Deltaproteobacteria bacterium]
MNDDHKRTAAGRVTHVRVFVDRAMITRSRVLPAHATQVTFEPIPIDTDLTTFRASASFCRSLSPIRIAGVTSSAIYSDESTAGRATLERALREVDETLQSLADADAVEERAEQLLGEYTTILTRSLSSAWLDRDPEFEGWGQALDLLRKREGDILTARALREIERGALERRKSELSDELIGLSEPRQLALRVVVLLEPCADNGEEGGEDGSQDGREIEVALSYLTKHAGWTPSYDARYLRREDDLARNGHSAGGAERMELCCVALVVQSTGEDWSDVELVATTAEPALSDPPPELIPIVVRGRAGVEKREILSSTKDVAKLGGVAGPGGRAKDRDGTSAPDGSHGAAEYTAPGRVRIPSTGKASRVELFRAEFSCQARLEAVPRARGVAMLVAELENRTAHVLLPGRVNVFRGPNFSGQTSLGRIAPNERFRVALGTDAAVRVRCVTRIEPLAKAALTGTVSHEFVSRTVVENASAEEKSLLLRDRIPVSRTEAASVKVIEMDRTTVVEPETGLTSLALTLAPHARREVLLSFKVSAPRGFLIRPPG